MFTGIIEETGSVTETKFLGGGYRISISAVKVLEETKIGDSININGVCQTVVDLQHSSFSVETVEETVKKTTLGTLRNGDKVNLERAMRADSRFGGHFVLGHVDATGEIVDIWELKTSVLVTIRYPQQFDHYIIPQGSVAVDGISLTIAELEMPMLTVSIIPHTFKQTTLAGKRKRDAVNLEFDVLGKYAAKLLGKKSAGTISEEWLREQGF